MYQVKDGMSVMKLFGNVTGINKFLFNIKVKVSVFLHFLPAVIKGEISVPKYTVFCGGYCISCQNYSITSSLKSGIIRGVDLYVPGYPGEAFYTACKKFMTFDEKLPNTTVLISITSACRFDCEHCYQKKDLGKDVDIDKLVPVVKRLQDMDIAFFNIEGGEPFLVYDRLRKVCEVIDSRRKFGLIQLVTGWTCQNLPNLKN